MSLVLLLRSARPAVVQAAEHCDISTVTAAPAPPPIDVHLALTGAQVQATLTMPLSPLPAVGRAVPIPFHVPEAYLPPLCPPAGLVSHLRRLLPVSVETTRIGAGLPPALAD